MYLLSLEVRSPVFRSKFLEPSQVRLLSRQLELWLRLRLLTRYLKNGVAVTDVIRTFFTMLRLMVSILGS